MIAQPARASRPRHLPCIDGACAYNLRKSMSNPYLVYCTADGEIREEPNVEPLAFGDQPLSRADLIPLPDGATLSMMPDRLAVGHKRSGERRIVPQSRGW